MGNFCWEDTRTHEDLKGIIELRVKSLKWSNFICCNNTQIQQQSQTPENETLLTYKTTQKALNDRNKHLIS
jgi:hypothetical protein